jgi:hypothetical protein
MTAVDIPPRASSAGDSDDYDSTKQAPQPIPLWLYLCRVLRHASRGLAFRARQNAVAYDALGTPEAECPNAMPSALCALFEIWQLPRSIVRRAIFVSFL